MSLKAVMPPDRVLTEILPAVPLAFNLPFKVISAELPVLTVMAPAEPVVKMSARVMLLVLPLTSTAPLAVSEPLTAISPAPAEIVAVVPAFTVPRLISPSLIVVTVTEPAVADIVPCTTPPVDPLMVRTEPVALMVPVPSIPFTLAFKVYAEPVRVTVPLFVIPLVTESVPPLAVTPMVPVLFNDFKVTLPRAAEPDLEIRVKVPVLVKLPKAWAIDKDLMLVLPALVRWAELPVTELASAAPLMVRVTPLATTMVPVAAPTEKVPVLVPPVTAPMDSAAAAQPV